ncbi:Linear gramicidin synthase subunit B [Micromonospora sp. MW-13]|uniref:condensation domain-containing protein n=1 Tax=Micromonospora sp. MW-13 TaxID=2094022 RepID=UPI000E441256|nr:condensation domain-containing protein [Micromonospora sp. MW-13]RGC66671.1 Linear gramicidin synthase subunit B [Micromonospora sp. MW-13]
MRFADAVVPTEWADETLVHAPFRGAGAGTAPLTWAQQVIWRANARHGSNHRFLNLRRTVPLSARAGADTDRASRVLGALVGRHGSLRTRVRTVDGEPRQETAATGQLPLLVLAGTGDGAQAARDAADRLGDVAFDHAREWPVRVALVTVDGRVRQVVLVFSHSTVDAHAAEVVLRDLRLILLRGQLDTPPGPQSVDVARLQHGADRRRSERAVAYWLREFARLPAEPLPPGGPGLTPRLRRGVLVSSAVDLAARAIAAHHRVSTSAVLLAGVTALAAARAGRDRCGLFPMAHNRFAARYANAVANLGQIGFGVLDVADRPAFPLLLSRVWQASLNGLRHACYDPAALRRAFADADRDYETAFLPHYYFNDVRLPVGGAVAAPEVTRRDLRAAMARTGFSWTRGLDRASWHLLTHVVDEPGGVGITLTVDTRHVAVDTVEPFLRELEELLVEAAFAEVSWPSAAPAAAPVVAATPPVELPAEAGEEMAYAQFAGGRAATGPLTWGQRAMWRAVEEFESPSHSVLNLRRVLAVSARADVDVARAVRAVAALVDRHESLRTRVRSVDGELYQSAAPAGGLPVLVHPVPPAAADPDGRSAAAALAARLGEPRFDHAAEWPLRAALVTVDGRVRQVVLVFSHSTVDFHATETVLRDLRMLVLRGALSHPPGPQSLDVAERERDRERRRCDRAVAYWLRQFPGLTVGLFDPVGPGHTPRYRRGSMVSEAVYHAVRLVAARHGVSSATALLGATAAVLTAEVGGDACGVFTMANNRFQPEYDVAISKLNQIGLCRLDLADRPGFAELLSRARKASLDAYRHAYYDPNELERAFAERGIDYRTALAPFCYLNDIRLPHDNDPGPAGPDEATMRAAASRSTFRWLEELDRFGWRCRLQVIDAPGAVELAVTVDTRYLPPERAERFLRAVEALLVEAAFHDVPWPWSPPPAG